MQPSSRASGEGRPYLDTTCNRTAYPDTCELIRSEYRDRVRNDRCGGSPVRPSVLRRSGEADRRLELDGLRDTVDVYISRTPRTHRHDEAEHEEDSEHREKQRYRRVNTRGHDPPPSFGGAQNGAVQGLPDSVELWLGPPAQPDTAIAAQANRANSVAAATITVAEVIKVLSVISKPPQPQRLETIANVSLPAPMSRTHALRPGLMTRPWPS